MKKLFLLTKTLLAAALLCVGQNAWGDTQTINVLSENYESYSAGDIKSTMQSNGWTFQYKNYSTNPSVEIVQGTGVNTSKYLKLQYNDGGAERNQYWTFPSSATSALTEDNWTFTFDGAINPGANVTYSLALAGTSSTGGFNSNTRITGSTAFFYMENASAGSNTFSAKVGGSDVSGTFALASDTWYKFTVKVTNIDTEKKTATVYAKITSYDEKTTLMESTQNNVSTTSIGTLKGLTWWSPKTQWSRLLLDNVLLTKEVDASVCAEPTSTLTGVSGTSRKYTLACETPASTIYYSETEKTYEDDGWTEYSGEFTTSATTIYTYAATTSAHSDVTSFATGAGTAVTLNAPSAYISAMTSSGSIYNPTYNATSDQTDKPLSPVATITATFKGASVSLPYTVTSSGTLAITASAGGYTSATTNIVYDFVPSYDITKSADFTEINESNLETKLDDTWTIAGSSTRWGSWSTTGGVDKDGNPNGGNAYWPVSTSSSFPITVYDFVKLNTNGTQLLIGWGFGRNSASNTNFTIADAESTAVAEYIVSNYGGSAYSVFRYNTDNLSYNVANGVVKGVKYYTTVVPASITSTTGYATFSSTSPVNVDVEGLEAYIATGRNGDYITMEKVTGDIAANTGLVLKGTTGTTYNLPVKASGDTPSGNLLQPCDGSWTTLTKSNTGTNYVLSEQGDPKVAVFAPIGNTNATLRAGSAYLYIEGVSLARALRFSFGDVTGVENVEAAEAKAQDGKFIENGKLVIVKNGVKYNAAGQQVK